jgi:hypothetical protein
MKLKILTAAIIWMMIHQLNAQDNTLYFMPMAPQNIDANPALKPGNNFVSIPALGSVGLSFYNSGFAWSDLIHEGTGAQRDSLIIDLDNLDGKLQKNNLFTNNTSAQLFSLGISIDPNNFLSLSVNSKIKTRLSYPGSLLDIRYGNWDYANDVPISHSFSDMGIDMVGYSEIALGWSRKMSPKLTLGARIKYLMGHAQIISDRMELGIKTEVNGDVTFSTDALIRVAAPLDVTLDEEGYIEDLDFKDEASASDFFSGNSGWAVDLGATYKFSERLTMEASITDLGAIRWQSNTHTFSSNDSFLYTGLDFSDSFANKDNDRDYLEELTDSIENTFRVSQEKASFTSGLEGSMRLAAKYKANNWLSVGGLLHNRFLDGTLCPEFTLSGGVNSGQWINFVATWTLRKNSFANFGTGLMLMGGPLQFYLVTDNIGGLLNMSDTHLISMRTGLNLIF